jgi:hypothetical protein
MKDFKSTNELNRIGIRHGSQLCELGDGTIFIDSSACF